MVTWSSKFNQLESSLIAMVHCHRLLRHHILLALAFPNHSQINIPNHSKDVLPLFHWHINDLISWCHGAAASRCHDMSDQEAPVNGPSSPPRRPSIKAMYSLCTLWEPQDDPLQQGLKIWKFKWFTQKAYKHGRSAEKWIINGLESWSNEIKCVKWPLCPTKCLKAAQDFPKICTPLVWESSRWQIPRCRGSKRVGISTLRSCSVRMHETTV